ncbi:hypothetical protein [Peribacillus asahii]|uniref:hypothetical protein n=1 Tax=Peribacillus asahii TaxID=228899 RepID=UPI002079BB5D|nr:hypothetical protein [Peribacillus asahii]USK84898.1 hypothetical protein LIT35_21365 [Peribacillus asahii]
MSKNKAIKVVTAAVIAGSAIIAVAPAQSEAATNSVDKAITKATNQMTKAFNAYYKEAKYEGKLPSTTTIRKEAKLARDYYEAAKKEIAKNGGSTSKKAAYTKKLDASKPALNRVENYVDAINVNIAAKKKAFEAAVKGGTQSKVLIAQEALDQKNAEFKKAVAKVFGPDARRLLLAKYAAPADKLSATVDAEMAVYKAYRDIERKDLIETDLVAAKKLMDKVEKQVAAIEKKNTKLAQNIMKAVKKNKAAYKAATANSKQLDAIVNKATNQMTKAFNAYYEEAKYEGKLPSTTTIRKEAKLARDYYEAAKAAIAKNGGSAAYTKKLEANKVYLNRVENYVKAINVNVAAKKTAFEAAVKSGMQSKVLAAQEALDQKNAEFKAAVAKVFGPDARRLLLAKYAAPADKLSATVDAEMEVYKAYRQIEREDLIEKDLVEAGRLIADVEKYVAVIEKKNTKLAQNIMKAVKKNKEAYEKAKAGTVTSQKKLDEILAEAKDGAEVTIKIQATESLKIATEKALKITLTGDLKNKDLTIDAPNAHVTNKAANSGKVTINDVSNTSYEQVGTYGSLVVNDTNGGRIINGTLDPLNITIGAGAKVTLVGNFGKVTVLGNAEITLSAGSVIQEVAATGGAVTVILEEGAKVDKTTGDVIVTPPPGPTPDPDIPGISNMAVTIAGQSAVNGTVDLSGADDSDKISEVTVAGAPANAGFVITSVKAVNRNIELIKSGSNVTVPTGDGDFVVTSSEILGELDGGNDGVSLGTLRSILGGGDLVIKGYIKKSGYNNYNVETTIKLGASVGSPIIQNEYFKIEKKGNNTAEVTVYTNKDVTLGTLANQGFDFPTILAATIFNDAGSADKVIAALLAITNGNTIELTKLSGLVNQTITLNGYTVTFKDAKK